MSGPTGFEVRLEVPAPVERVWLHLVDWPAHGRWVPLTTVRVLTPSGAGVGARFVGRTGIGPLGFDDPMEVVLWRPPEQGRPGRCEVVKQGRVVRGGAQFEVSAGPDGTTTVVWTEQIDLPPQWLTRRLRPLIAAAGRWAFGRALRVMAREVVDQARGPGDPAGQRG